MVLLRRLLGDALRRNRLRQHRTLREVSAAARVSLGYLSEVERGQKEASSELLAAICDALDLRLADVLREVSEALDFAELAGTTPAPAPVEVARPAAVPAAVPVGFAPPRASIATATSVPTDGGRSVPLSVTATLGVPLSAEVRSAELLSAEVLGAGSLSAGSLSAGSAELTIPALPLSVVTAAA